MPVPVPERQIEQLTQRLGRDMFERMRSATPGLFQPVWWQERMLNVLMRNEWLKVQAFRLIDVLPTLGDEREVARHLREYFVHPHHARGGRRNGLAAPDHPPDEPAGALRELETGGPDLLGLVSRIMDFQRADSLRARVLARLAWWGAQRMARQFIAGSNVREAEQAIRRLRERQMGFTIDVLGEAALSERESRHYQQVYLDLLTQLPRSAANWPRVPLIDEAEDGPLPRVNVSVKLSALYSRFDAIDPEGTRRCVKERLRPLLRKGMEQGAHVHIDMEHFAIKDLTLQICREIFMEDEFREYPHFGLVLQAYLKDCERDAAELIEWARQRGVPIWVRLVKGAYWDTESVLHEQAGWDWPVWEQKWQSDACFERVTRMLLAHHGLTRTAFGSHNIRSLAHAMALRQLWEIPGTNFELQMLYGMGEAIKQAAVEMGQRCRIYTPYGDELAGMAYLIRRLLENTANESFLRHSVDEDTPVEALLCDPVQIGRQTPPREKPPLLRYEFGELIMDPFENIPHTGFGREENRDRMRSALARVRADSGREYPLIIGGQRIATGHWSESRNPAQPAEVIGRVARADRVTTEQAVRAASSAMRSWRLVPARERADLLVRVAEIIQRRRFELAALLCLECGMPWREADAEVSQAVDLANYYGREMIRLAENLRRRDIPGEANEYFYTPRGGVAAITPWSAPLAAPAGIACAALVTGNTVVLKPATPAAVAAAALMEILEEAGAPPGVANYLPGSGATVGEMLVTHPEVATVAFGGSRAVGCRINHLAAEHPTARPALRRVIAEMGGKNAIIVDSDADVDEAIKGVVASAFGCAGQSGSACSRCIVVEPLYERFADRLVEASRSLAVGPAEDPATFVPPLIDRTAWESVRQYVEIGRREAGCVLEVDVREQVEKSGGGFYVGPSIFADVPPGARIAQEEIFGPILALIRARDFDQAVEIFNGTEYARTGGVYSRSPSHVERARAECQCSNLFINRRITGARVDLQPLGGVKLSGQGALAGGPHYLVQFCEPRCVTENTLRRGFAPSEEFVEALG